MGQGSGLGHPLHLLREHALIGAYYAHDLIHMDCVVRVRGHERWITAMVLPHSDQGRIRQYIWRRIDVRDGQLECHERGVAVHDGLEIG